MFSQRLGSLEETELWRVLSRKRAAGDEVFDLTESNPTRIGLVYPSDEILGALAQPGALDYEPATQGHLTAREAVRHYYRERGKDVSTDDIVLTAGTSEAYSFLFKLLCEPGDEVLVPQPSYPLLETLASLEAVVPVPYSIDDGPGDALSPRCRAIIAVHPNNPTGSYVSENTAARLMTLSRDNDVALIVDEVFLDYTIRGATAASFAGAEQGLVFVLSGLSKLAGLPQMKLSWITMSGSTERRDEARRRLEHIADAFLSVGTPVQLAAPRFLELASSMRERIRERVEENLSIVEQAVERVPEVTFPVPGGGWYGTLRLPAVASSEEWALEFLERVSVYVHPGAFFGFERGSYVVISLLPPPGRSRIAIERVLRVVSDRVNSSGA